MTVTHLCNAFFEQELAFSKTPPLIQLIQTHPVCPQLQFLPLLYRKKGERVVISQFPSHDYLDYLESQGFFTEEIDILDRPASPFELQLWGASRAAQTWAQNHGGSVLLPEWETVREIHSKIYSFTSGVPIPSSHLLANVEEAAEWAASFEGPKVLKKAFGASASGHLRIDGKKLPPPAISLFDQNLPVLGEPWVERVFDFSTQWMLSNTIDYVGATLLQTSPKGMYLGTLAGDEDALFKDHARALQEHLEQCRPLLKKIRALGYFGHVGIDAFVYLWQGKRRLRTIAEINARKTMGWAALEIQKQHFPGQILHLRYEKSGKKKGFLPSELGSRTFSRQLFLETMNPSKYYFEAFPSSS